MSYGLGAIGDGLFVVPLVEVGGVAVSVGQGNGRVASDRLGAIGDGFAVVLLVEVGGGAVAVGRGVRGVEADGLIEIGDSSVVVALVAVSSPTAPPTSRKWRSFRANWKMRISPVSA
jgi:hypothetical protein